MMNRSKIHPFFLAMLPTEKFTVLDAAVIWELSVEHARKRLKEMASEKLVKIIKLKSPRNHYEYMVK
jgi:hypothetical protein